MIKSYAKLNLYLEVVNKRQDGYHNLKSIMTSIALHDSIYIKKRKDSLIKISCTNKSIPIDEHNLVYQVVNYLQKEYNISQGLNIHIVKKIPMGGGLAGGSSNAAAVLVYLNHQWNINLSKEALNETALLFGSDVPYCLFHQTALATSRGENLYMLNTTYNGYVVIINPNIVVSTKEIFTNYPVKKEPIHSFHVNDFKQYDIMNVFKYFYNELEEIVFERYPEILNACIELLQMGVEKPLMSGSGSSVFAVFPSRKEAKQIAKRYQSLYPNHYVIVSKFI
jgi:4-diphosphocytidyl-2-C-methyl-D-erythritol kinase